MYKIVPNMKKQNKKATIFPIFLVFILLYMKCIYYIKMFIKRMDLFHSP